ncbi:hypothetical protein LXL04_005828 [Taraxacum kok-saghyz]
MDHISQEYNMTCISLTCKMQGFVHNELANSTQISMIRLRKHRVSCEITFRLYSWQKNEYVELNQRSQKQKTASVEATLLGQFNLHLDIFLMPNVYNQDYQSYPPLPTARLFSGQSCFSFYFVAGATFDHEMGYHECSGVVCTMAPRSQTKRNDRYNPSGNRISRVYRWHEWWNGRKQRRSLPAANSNGRGTPLVYSAFSLAYSAYHGKNHEESVVTGRTAKNHSTLKKFASGKLPKKSKTPTWRLCVNFASVIFYLPFLPVNLTHKRHVGVFDFLGSLPLANFLGWSGSHYSFYRLNQEKGCTKVEEATGVAPPLDFAAGKVCRWSPPYRPLRQR